MIASSQVSLCFDSVILGDPVSAERTQGPKG
jgi:hypothetical protein